MTGWKPVLAWAVATIGGLALVGLGTYFVATGLDRADKLASVIGAFVGMIGLAVAMYGVVLARRGQIQPDGQTVAGSTVGGEVLQVRRVHGGLRVGSRAAAPLSAPVVSARSASRPTTTPGGQSVIGTQTSGPVRQVDDVGGDAVIDR
jgi:hypothetical protein